MKRFNFSILNLHGIEIMLLPTIGFKVVDGYYDRKIHFCIAWLCFGLSIRLKTIKDNEER